MSFQPSEERYWTDYLRIALPIVGLLLMLALFWFWAAKIIGDENGAEPTAKVPATTVLITPTNPAPTATSKTNITAPEVTATVAQGPDTGAPTPTGNEQATEAPSGETPTEGNAVGKGFAVGDAATVNDDGVNLRSGPTTDSDIVGQLALGDEVKITKAATKVDADGRAWVEVEVQNGDLEGQSGYISDEFLDAE